MSSKTPIFAVGDKVAYSVQFLRSVGASHSEMARGRGIVTGIENVCPDFTLIAINWINVELPEKVRDCNLAKVGLNTRFSNC
jgi:hypothetical protein